MAALRKSVELKASFLILKEKAKAAMVLASIFVLLLFISLYLVPIETEEISGTQIGVTNLGSGKIVNRKIIVDLDEGKVTVDYPVGFVFKKGREIKLIKYKTMLFGFYRYDVVVNQQLDRMEK